MNLRSAFLLLGVVGLVACAGEGTGSDTASASNDIVGQVLGNTAKVAPKTLTFPKSAINQVLRDRITQYQEAIAAGKKRADVDNVILVGDRQSDATNPDGSLREGLDNPYGFLRRALSFRDHGDETIIDTEDATLEDALVVKEFDDGEVIQIGSGDAKPQAGGLRPQGLGDIGRPVDFKIPVLNITEKNRKEIFRKGQAFVRINSANVTIDTTIDVHAKIGLRGLSAAHAFVEAQVNSALEVEIGGGPDLKGTKEMDLFSSSWPVGAIGPIPMTLTLNTFIGCELGVEGTVGVTSKMGASVHMRAGGTYERDSGMKTEFQSPSFDPTFERPEVEADARAFTKCYVRPRIAILFAGMVGPFVAPQGYVRLDAAVIPPPLAATLKAGAAVSVGGELSILGHEIGKLETKAFPIGSEKVLWSL